MLSGPQHKTLLMVEVHTLVLDTADSFHNSFVVVLGFSLKLLGFFFLSARVDLCPFPEPCSGCVHPRFLYLYKSIRCSVV